MVIKSDEVNEVARLKWPRRFPVPRDFGVAAGSRIAEGKSWPTPEGATRIATLRIYRSGHRLDERLPTLALLSRPASDIRAVAERLLAAVQAFAGESFVVHVEPCASQIGSGALPVDRLPSFAVHVASRSRRGGRALEQLARRLRAAPVPVLGRIGDDALWLDCRTLLAQDEATLVAQLAAAQP